MLSNEDIQMLCVPNSQKIDALFEVLHKLDDADDTLYRAIYDYMPMSENDAWQDEADKFFWHSDGMNEINDVSFAIRNVRDLALLALHKLEGTSHAHITY